MAHLHSMDLDDIALVDKGANQRRHAVLKRDQVLTFADRVQREIGMATIRKAAPSFGQLMAVSELSDWLPDALDAVGQVVYAALTQPDDGTGTITPAVRASAAINAVDDFRAGLLDRVATGIGKRWGTRTVSRGKAPIGKHRALAGFLSDAP